jgi:hypothetical protein
MILVKLVTILWNYITDLEYFIKYLQTVAFPSKYYDHLHNEYLYKARGMGDNSLLIKIRESLGLGNASHVYPQNSLKVKGSLERIFLQECCHRIGFYNFWSPLFPDGNYELHLNMNDERELFLNLISLATMDSSLEVSFL